jgi:hypothetical protein
MFKIFERHTDFTEFFWDPDFLRNILINIWWTFQIFKIIFDIYSRHETNFGL